jgi:uncharacterized membrane protein YfcA
MKDRLLLIFAGGICALLAWAFWKYLGSDALSLLPTVMLIVAVIDNVRLRRQLRNGGAARGKRNSI